MKTVKPYSFFCSQQLNKYVAAVASHTATIVMLFGFFCVVINAEATNYLVSDKSSLQSKMSAALPGDTITVANGTYNWGQIIFTNTKASSATAWIVLQAQTRNGVVFTGTTYLQFSGTRILIAGFKFTNGSSPVDVIQFRSSSTVFANYCRVTNITIDNYNSDSTGAYLNNGSDIDNKWVSLYGTHNRVDHCTFINKFNAGATVVVWYDNNNYPAKSTATYHTIDSNYFKGRGYLGSNGGESIRVGTSANSRTDGYNLVAYNLFEDEVEIDPEIISNKSNYNTYCYNTIRNCKGGITMRHGRYCSVYGNFFIVNNAAVTSSYGVRLIDKGHKVYNNYIEATNGNKNSLTSLRCPIILYNGLSSTNDTTDASKANGYFPADSCLVAFNTIVNAVGGAGIVLGFTDGGSNTYQPKGIIVANNLIKMSSGQAAYIDAVNTQLTYTAEGNIYNAISGLGLSSANGFNNTTLTFGARSNGILVSPTLVQDAAINTSNYASILNNIDAQQQARTAIFDVGASELDGTGTVVAFPLDSTLVGAGTPIVTLPVTVTMFNGFIANNAVTLQWQVQNEINFKTYEIEYGSDGINFSTVAAITATQQVNYQFTQALPNQPKLYYRLKLIDTDGTYSYSKVVAINNNHLLRASLYPNPANSFIIVKIDNASSNVIVAVINNLGQVLEKVQVNGSQISIATNQLASGLYHVQISQDGRSVNNLPFIINKF